MNSKTELEMLRAASVASKTGAWKWLLANDKIYWTEVTHELFDVPKGVAIDLETGLSFYDEESKTRLIPEIEACKTTGKPWDLIARCISASGRLFWARSVGVAVRNNAGKIIALEGAFQDVTEAEEARQQKKKAEANLTSVLQTMPSGFFVLDENWCFSFVNIASKMLLRRDPATLIGANIWEQFPEAVGSPFEEHYRAVMESGESKIFTAHFEPFQTSFLVSAHKTPVGIAVHFRDITEEEKTKAAAKSFASDLTETNKRLSTVADVAPVGLYEFRREPSGDVTFPYCSDRFCEMLGVERAELKRPLHEMLDTRIISGASDFATSLQKSAEHLTLWSYRFAIDHPEKGVVWYEGRSMPRRVDDGAIIWTGALLDVTQDVERQLALQAAFKHQETIREEKEKLALTDDLTSLSNRRAHDVELMHRIQPVFKDQLGSTVLIRLDLDHFKYVNDTLGHDAGDAVLKRVSTVLKKCVRPNDFVARIGGDEFSILLAPGSTEAHGRNIIRRIQLALLKPVLHDGRPCRFGASFGLIATENAASLGDDLQRFVDAALYRAKESGRNRVEVFTPELQREISRHRKIAVNLQDAMERNEFVPHFQPQVSATDGRLVGVEALLRWHHPDHGVLLPGDFLAVANQLHLTAELDRRVMELSRDVVARLKRQGVTLPKISFNISPGRMQAQNLLDLVADGGFGKTAVTFELLESILLEEESSIFKCHLHRIREAGVAIEIDDFGSGHASILSVMQVSPAALKIDRRLIAPIAHSNQARKMVRAIMEIARTLEVEAVAEGVENQRQAQILREEGCDTLQGFLFAKPLSEAALADFALKRLPLCA